MQENRSDPTSNCRSVISLPSGSNGARVSALISIPQTRSGTAYLRPPSSPHEARATVAVHRPAATAYWVEGRALRRVRVFTDPPRIHGPGVSVEHRRIDVRRTDVSCQGVGVLRSGHFRTTPRCCALGLGDGRIPGQGAARSPHPGLEAGLAGLYRPCGGQARRQQPSHRQEAVAVTGDRDGLRNAGPVQAGRRTGAALPAFPRAGRSPGRSADSAGTAARRKWPHYGGATGRPRRPRRHQ